MTPETRHNQIVLNDKKLRLWGVPLVVLSGLLTMMQFYFAGRWDLFGKYLIASFIYATITWEICRWVLIRVRQSIPGLENTRKRLVLTMIYFFIVAGIGNAVVKLVLQSLGLRPPSMIDRPFFEWWLANMSSVLFFVLLLSCIYEAIYFLEQYKVALKKAESLKKQQAQQQLDALKNRVNPHFLFNSLTSLAALIGEDGRRAEQFVDELSKVYRYLLRAGRLTHVTLEEELTFADSYVFLLQSRFGAGSFSWKKPAVNPPELQLFSLPVLTLQHALDYLLRTQNTPWHMQLEVIQKHLVISCHDHPKRIAIDVPAHDWQQLEHHGVVQETSAGLFKLFIPLDVNVLATSSIP